MIMVKPTAIEKGRIVGGAWGWFHMATMNNLAAHISTSVPFAHATSTGQKKEEEDECVFFLVHKWKLYTYIYIYVCIFRCVE